jgi:hypothetical protein
MSNIEIIEEYRALAVQAEQRAQFLYELLVGVLSADMADHDGAEAYVIAPSEVQAANETHTLKQTLDDDGNLVLGLEKKE